MKFVYTLLSILVTASVRQAHGATQLVDFGTVVYNGNGDGLPTSIPISFDSDFPIDQPGKTLGSAWVEWTLTENSGATLYNAINQDSNVAFTSTAAGPGNVMTFTLSPTGTPPPVGVTLVTLDVTIKYKNAAATMNMHQKLFKITITVVGSTATQALSTGQGSSTTTYTVQQGTGTATGGVLTPLPNVGLTLVQSGTAVAWGSPIIVQTSTTDANYKLWLDTSQTIEVYDAATAGNLLYVWPSALITAPTLEGAASNSLAITLNSVPVTLYNKGTVYIFLKIKFRDTEGGRRVLRVPAVTHSSQIQMAHRSLEAMAENSVDVSAPVELVPLDSSSDVVKYGNVLTLSGTAMAGLVLLM